jgi:hypothetical protein
MDRAEVLFFFLIFERLHVSHDEAKNKKRESIESFSFSLSVLSHISTRSRPKQTQTQTPSQKKKKTQTQGAADAVREPLAMKKALHTDRHRLALHHMKKAAVMTDAGDHIVTYHDSKEARGIGRRIPTSRLDHPHCHRAGSRATRVRARGQSDWPMRGRPSAREMTTAATTEVPTASKAVALCSVADPGIEVSRGEHC